MPFYRVILHGEGLSISSLSPETRVVDAPREDGPPIIGFYASRLIRAADQTEARRRAERLLLNEWAEGELAKMNAGSAPTITTESVEEVGLFEYLLTRSRLGFTFYT